MAIYYWCSHSSAALCIKHEFHVLTILFSKKKLQILKKIMDGSTVYVNPLNMKCRPL